MPTLIHATHEAAYKVGGIGAVLDGLLSAKAYLARVQRSIVVGPMDTRDPAEMERLFAPRNNLFVRYFADRGMLACDPGLAAALTAVEHAFGVRLCYATRQFGGAIHEMLLVDASEARGDRFNSFRYFVWQRFGLDSGRYEGASEYNHFMRMAEPAAAALGAILGDEAPDPRWVVCHEFMGLPLWYALALTAPGRYQSAYVAHEAPTARALVEGDGGHDTRFYNVMRRALDQGRVMDEVFGDQNGYFKHAMVRTAAQCDVVMAVGDPVVDELRFTDVGFRGKPIHLIYNGVPSQRISLGDTRLSGARLRGFAQRLIGVSPTWVFSHVTRMVPSKGLWRDLRVMEKLDGHLAWRGESAVLFMLSSVRPQGRSAAEAWRMSQAYGWPRTHRFGWPDLVDPEDVLYRAIERFNATARASRVILVNQFGWDRERVGALMPEDMRFGDLRAGSDLEFGQSIYEPFGIAQMEPLSAGSLCVVSDSCGCVGFARHAMGELGLVDARNIRVVDYTSLGDLGWRDPISIGTGERNAVEARAADSASWFIADSLPRDAAAKQALIDTGYAIAQRMSWDVVAGERMLPAMGL
ncbi:MAG: hypothetical protein K1X39_12435 [Thermoflexales bacterium]|nr:hypothetical protein [Thermoflexales bacterium]